MIEFKQGQMNDYNNLSVYFPSFVKNPQEKTDGYFIALESGLYLGFCSYRLDNARAMAYIDSIYIKKQYRRMRIGDGLLRSTLNHLSHQKIKSVQFFLDESYRSFFEFQEIPWDEDKKCWQVNLELFFNRSCKGLC